MCLLGTVSSTEKYIRRPALLVKITKLQSSAMISLRPSICLWAIALSIGVEGAPKISAKQLSLRGFRQSTSSASFHDQQQELLVEDKWRNLQTMFENTETQKHIIKPANGKKKVPQVPGLAQDRMGGGSAAGQPKKNASKPQELPSPQNEAAGQAQVNDKKKGSKGKGVGKGSSNGQAQQVTTEPSVGNSEVVQVTPQQNGTGGKNNTEQNATNADINPSFEASVLSEFHPDTVSGSSTKPVNKSRSSSVSDLLMTEIHVSIQYDVNSTQKATQTDYAELAHVTAEIFDYVFRSYFIDINEVAFEAVDPLAIYSVKGPLYIDFTIASYFAAASSLPTERQLINISLLNLHEGSAYYKFYLELLQSLSPDSVFQSTVSFQLYESKYSALTGPGQNTNAVNTDSRNTTRVFKVVVPIVILVVISVVAALIYTNWVENRTHAAKKDETQETRKKLTADSDDAEQTISSEREHTLRDREFSFSSGSPAGAPYPTSLGAVRRTFGADEFSVKIGFEEVALDNDDEDGSDTEIAMTNEKRPSSTDSINQFPEAIDNSPKGFRRSPVAFQVSLQLENIARKIHGEPNDIAPDQEDDTQKDESLPKQEQVTEEDERNSNFLSAITPDFDEKKGSVEDGILNKETHADVAQTKDEEQYEEETVESASVHTVEDEPGPEEEGFKQGEPLEIITGPDLQSQDDDSRPRLSAGFGIRGGNNELPQLSKEETDQKEESAHPLETTGRLKAFWEQKTAKKASLHDFWEQKTRGKTPL